jgi:drug/metabolite transporter (DMT)-like permease
MEGWFWFAVLSAAIASTRKDYEKQLTLIFGNFGMGFIIKVFSLIPILILCFFTPQPEHILSLPWNFWWPLLVIWIVLYPLQTFLYYRSMRDGELSHVLPIICIWPVLNGITSLCIGEYLPITSWVGMLCIFFGTLALLFHKGNSKEEEHKFRRAALYMFGATCCFAVGSSLDKVALRVSPPVFYMFVNSIGATVVFMFLIPLFKERYHFEHIKSRFVQLNIVGILFAVSFAFAMAAFKNAPTSSSLAIRTTVGFIIPSIMGIVYRGEKFTQRKKLAFILFAAGTLCIVVDYHAINYIVYFINNYLSRIVIFFI